MSELFRAVAFGLIASLMAATSAFAIEATAVGDADADNKQAVDLVSAGVAAKPAGDPNCPSVTLAPAGDSRKSDGARATLDALARDCANLGAETIVKVGLVGESTRKKMGDSDQVDAPITIQIKDGEGHEIEVRRVNLKVEMPEGVQKVSFQHVEENVSLPPPSADGYAKWTIVVGLDPAAPGEAEDEVASSDEQAEEPVAAPDRSSRYRRSARSYRAKSARVGAYRSARASRSGRQRIEIEPQASPVVMSAKPQAGAPAAIITTSTTPSNSGSSMARAAQSFTERRDRALQQQQQTGAAQAQRRPAPAAARAPTAANAVRQPQRRAPQAVAQQPAPSRAVGRQQSGRSAQATPARGSAEATQTN